MIEGILPFAKYSGETSFKSLWRVKRGLGTKKIGHTGTLDCFADGLLVVLVGTLTHLVPYFTACDKEYVARIEFGRETDTLDPHGKPVSTGDIPAREQLNAALPRFLGTIEQIPPTYSAIHVSGGRASDIARKGGAVSLAPRPVTIRELSILRDGLSESGTVDVRVSCSKGTYIRSLARDIACACGTVAHLSALRRVGVGPFTLRNAVGSSLIGEFGASAPESPALAAGPVPAAGPGTPFEGSLLPFDEAVARLIGLEPVILREDKTKAFCNGQDIDSRWFEDAPGSDELWRSGVSRPVFSLGEFVGMVRMGSGRFSYDFVRRVTV